MIISDHTHLFDQNLDKVFDYFLHKKIFEKLFRDSDEELAINSQFDDPRMREGEQIELIFASRKLISSFSVEVMEIQPGRLIDLSINVDELVDNSPSTFEEDEEDMAFLKKYFGMDMYCRLEFFKEFGQTRVLETLELKRQDLPWYINGIWKIVGFFNRFYKISNHRRIKEEIEDYA